MKTHRQIRNMHAEGFTLMRLAAITGLRVSELKAIIDKPAPTAADRKREYLDVIGKVHADHERARAAQVASRKGKRQPVSTVQSQYLSVRARPITLPTLKFMRDGT